MVMSAVAVPVFLALNKPEPPAKYTFSLKRAHMWAQYLNCLVDDGDSFSIIVEDSTGERNMLLVWVNDFSDDLDVRKRIVQDFEDWAKANGIGYKLIEEGSRSNRLPVKN